MAWTGPPSQRTAAGSSRKGTFTVTEQPDASSPGTPDSPDGDGLEELRSELAGLQTEAALPALSELDTMGTAELVAAMNEQNRGVPAAVEQASGEIAAVVDAVAERLARGGRLLYVGAGTAGRLGVLDASECPPTFGTPPGLVVGLIAGGPTALTRAVEGAEDDPDRGAADIDALGVGPADLVV